MLAKKRVFHPIVSCMLSLPVLAISSGVLASGHGPYGAIGAGVARIDYPESQFFADRGEASPFTRNYNLDTDKGYAHGVSVDGRLGTFLPGTIGGADAVRIEIQGFGVDANRSTNSFFSDTGAGMRFGWVELDNFSGFGTPNGSSLTTKIKQDIDYWGFDVPLLLDFGMGQNASWSFQVGPSFKRLDQDSDATGTIRDGGGANTTIVTLDDRLAVEFRGLMVGARYNRELNQQWSVSLDASMARYWSKMDYDSTYIDGINATQTASLNESDDALGVDLRLEVGRKLSSGLKVSAFGQINYLSDVPQVSYGSVPTDPGNGVLSLTSDDMTTLVLGLQVSGSF